MAETEISVPTRRKPWSLTLFSLLAIAGLVAMPFLAGEPDGDKMPDIVRFLGHFHPVLLHLPIGVFALILFQELCAIFGKRREEPANQSLFPMFFGAASSIVAVIAGFLLYHGHGDDYAGSKIADRHLWGGLIFAVAAVLTFIVRAWTVSNPAFYRLLLFGSVGIMGFASHDGASLTHGEDYLTIYAPDPIRKVMGLEPKNAPKAPRTPAAAAPQTPTPAPVAGAPTPAVDSSALLAYGNILVYEQIVHPIFERRCVQCHKEGKSRGRYRMDTLDRLIKGGKEAPGLVAGNSAESNLVIRMELPEDEDEHMPPEGKPDLSAHELAAVKWWIDAGAEGNKAISTYTIPADIQANLLNILQATEGAATAGSAVPSAEAGTEPAAAHAPAAAETSAVAPGIIASVEALSKEFPGAVAFESRQSQLVTFTAVSLRGNFDDAGFEKIAPLAPQLVTIDLSATRITDATVEKLAAAQNLKLVRLSETGVTDASIDTLVKLPSLESLNLYGTAVTDAGVAKLAALTSLKRLYLWKTAVTPDAVKALQEKLPACEIVTGTEP